MSAASARLSSSAFIADLGPREKSLWRIVVTVLAGGLAGFMVACVGGAVAILALAAATGALNGSLPEIAGKIVALISGNGSTLASALALLILAAASNTPLAATFICVAGLIAGRPILRYLTAASHFRWRLLLCGLAMSALFLGPIVAIGQLTDPHAAPPPLLALSTHLPARLAYAAACVLLLIPAAAAEEVLFRGWLLRLSAALSKNPLFLMAVNGVLFAAVHGINAPSELQPEPFLTRALMGAGFVYMTLRVGGIELSTGAHAGNNILFVLFVQPLTLSTTSQPGMSLDSTLQDAALFFSFILIAEITAHWTPLRRWVGVDLATGPASIAVAAPSP